VQLARCFLYALASLCLVLFSWAGLAISSDRLVIEEAHVADVYGYLPQEEIIPSFSIINGAPSRHSTEQELRDKNARLRRAETITGLGSWELHLPDGRITLSEGARLVLGWPTIEHSLEESGSIVLPEYREIRQQALRELVDEGKPYDIEFRVKRPSDGRLVDIHSIAEYSPETSTVFGTLLDITDWKRSEEALMASQRRNTRSLLAFAMAQLGVIVALAVNIRERKKVERKNLQNEIALKEEKERLKATLLSVGDGVIATNQHGEIEIINKVAQKLTGWPEREALGRPFDQAFVTTTPKTWEKRDESLRKVLHSGVAVGLTNHTILLAKDGTARHIADSAAPIKDDRDTVSGAVLVFRDVTLEKSRIEEIEYLSYHDQLTGLHNRRFMERALKKLNTTANLPISIVMADLNGLKLVNDTLGHTTGDRLLRRAAEVITAKCRESDIIARWGGDEFILLLPRTNSAEVEMIVSRIELALQMEEVESLLVSMSFGWGTKTDPKQTIDNVFKRAENHMYRSKLYQSPGIRGETIDALMAALFEKNQREEEHSQRVSDLCQLVGKTLGLSDWKVKELGLIGLFHDIGKIAVDESTLNKPTTLTEDEWKELRRHPEVGYRLLSAVQDMSDIALYVLAHHERWDGRGYPKGLRAEEIPLESRIVGVADAYDAMISYRPYRKSLSRQEAIAELRRHAGTQLDPTIVEIFIAAIDDWEP
jgi:diguanylate cyclase (GGDEF)-like protein/PAS domain S-box-containing protein